MIDKLDGMPVLLFHGFSVFIAASQCNQMNFFLSTEINSQGNITTEMGFPIRYRNHDSGGASPWVIFWGRMLMGASIFPECRSRGANRSCFCSDIGTKIPKLLSESVDTQYRANK